MKLNKFDKKIAKRCKCLCKENLLEMKAKNFADGIISLPLLFTLKQYSNVVYNQGQLGSCVECAICALLRITDPSNSFNPSVLQLYTNTLILENEGEIVDEGSDAMDAITVLEQIGVCDESFMPYTVDSITGQVANFGQLPSPESLLNAAEHKYTGFTNITPETQWWKTIRTAISTGYPVLLAFYVPKSFDNIGSNGIMPVIKDDEEVIGGHEILLVNYNQNYLTGLNSWSARWGRQGYVKIPINFLWKKYYGERYVKQLVIYRPVQT